MTFKKERKLKAKELKNSGLPFILSHILSRWALDYDFWGFQAFTKRNDKFTTVAEQLTYCECCGPEAIKFVWKNKQYTISYWNWHLQEVHSI